MATGNLIKKAAKISKEAAKLDNKGLYEKAYSKYLETISLLLKVLKLEKNSAMKANLRSWCEMYIKRAEDLKEMLSARKQGALEKVENGSLGDAPPNSLNPGCSLSAEEKRLQAALSSAVLQEKQNVKWDDIAGLTSAKDALKEAVILPIRFPQLFTGNRRPWSGILLYGPPGTGKSYLAKAVATEASSTFFSISSSDLVSKWMGESERMVKQLFQMARSAKPSIIFIDEFDSMASLRKGDDHESSSRMKTEFLVQMNGVGNENDNVLVLAATNIPWKLDPAIRRRFERRIYIPLPAMAARVQMIKIHIGSMPCNLQSENYIELARATEGFSGADINVMVRDALMEPVRTVQRATHFKKIQCVDPNTGKACAKLLPCLSTAKGAIQMTWLEVKSDGLLEPELTMSDFRKAVVNCKPTVSAKDLELYEKFTREFGNDGS